jgi:hypothetical protein
MDQVSMMKILNEEKVNAGVTIEACLEVAE